MSTEASDLLWRGDTVTGVARRRRMA